MEENIQILRYQVSDLAQVSALLSSEYIIRKLPPGKLSIVLLG